MALTSCTCTTAPRMARTGALRLAALWLLVAAWGLAAGEARAQTIVNRRHEYNVKAAFLYSFGRYVQWPAHVFTTAETPLVIGVVGEDPFAGALDEIAAKKQIQGRKLIVRRFASAAEVQDCQILFVSHALPAEQQTEVIRRVGKSATLLVGETPGFATAGGNVNFYLDNDTVRFEINPEGARAAGLKLEAKLLALGRRAAARAP